ncbi:thioesterase family protein [Atopomonas sediminilitoris]|uniref:thioesterase family protein n=1 Tax=Atopomonas sediminilitoris TaxID=2919919 RepID=UPI001F4DBDE2|nr:thioesterase family protein [Atopomonas sediminilitoris]MCJ8169561.1 thioesterase family protein [Atopomonas sediminilitoris]
MSHDSPVLDPLVREGIARFIEQIPFNKLLGIELLSIEEDAVEMRVPMRPELVGNYLHGILHGGVTATILDVAGGLMALVGASLKNQHLSSSERMARLSKLGTIDLRVDYLRPGRGTAFIARATPLRSGNKVAVIRCELHALEGELIAVGTGTYLCG